MKTHVATSVGRALLMAGRVLLMIVGGIVGLAALAMFAYVVFDLARDAAAEAGASPAMAAGIGAALVAGLFWLVATGHGEWGE